MKLRISDLVKTLEYRIKAFLFDLDGTLIDSSKAIFKTITKVLSSKEHHYDSDKIATVIGMPLEQIFGILIPVLSDKEIRQYVLEYRDYYSIYGLKSTKLHSGADSLLRKLKKHDFKLGLTTTKYRKFALEELRRFNLVELFDTVVTGYEVKQHKPAPDIIIEAAKRLGITPSDCVVFGDSPLDIRSGKKAGALTIAVLTGPYDKRQFLKVKPSFIIESLNSIQI
ncbi:MAG: HAD family hydrolase [Candidatus Hodarchaeota archaeon]